MSDSDDTNIAANYREIAANANSTTGRILKKIDKAAKQGHSHVEVDVDEEDDSAVRSPEYILPTPLIEKLKSYGFILHSTSKRTFFLSRPVIDIWW